MQRVQDVVRDAIVRLELRDDKVAHEEVIVLQRAQRIRDVRQGPDGCLYVLTDARELLRLEPAP